MKRKIFLFFILFIITIVFPSFSFAHPGNTDAYGCHTCRTNCPSWGLYYGEYHCHTPKTYIEPLPIYVPVYIPPPRPNVICNSVNATNVFIPNNEGTFFVNFDWDDVQTAQGYSIAIYKYAFGDPGPNQDTVTSDWVFSNVTTGDWHVAIKSNINNVWSNICDWTIQVPEWYPPPTLTTSFPTSTSSTINSFSISDIPITSFLFFGIAGYLFYLLVKRVKK